MENDERYERARKRLINAVARLTGGRFLGPEWEERKAREIVARDERQIHRHAA